MKTYVKKNSYTSKQMTSFLFEQMKKLDNKEIKPEDAMAQAKLASQINLINELEIKRSLIKLQFARFVNSEIETIDSTQNKIENKKIERNSYRKI
jgi:hypothetical protein